MHSTLNHTSFVSQPEATISNRRVFLTGGSGYVGRNLIRHFTAQGAEIVALVRSAQSAETVRSLGAIPYSGDLFTSELAKGMQDCDALVHVAADTDHGPATDRQRNINIEGTRNIFEAAYQAGVMRALYVSSESVLLDGSPLVAASEDYPFPCRPAGGYSRTKGEAERIALSFGSRRLDVIVVRPRFVWGRDDTTALPQLVAAVQTGKFAWIDGGRYLTSTTHIDNLCHGLDLALQRGRSGEVYFITDGTPVEFRSFVERLLQTQHVVAPEKNVPRPLLKALAIAGDAVETVSRGRIRAPINRQTFATSAVEVTLDITKARKKLGYEPIKTIEAGLSELISTRKGS
jgi:nucleoside-diphosphate-sugar epimerase